MDSRTVCTICEQERIGGEGWFLLAENEWLDRLKILAWNDRLAIQKDVHCLCCAAHVHELVAHWMATESLDYPFARLPLAKRQISKRRNPPLVEQAPAFDSPVGEVIGELAVHRESLSRVLQDNPHSLVTILEPLLNVLRQQHTQPEPQSAPLVFCGVGQ